MNEMTEYQLFQCRTKQPFRVAKSTSEMKGKWYWFGNNKYLDWNLREILDSEIVIEFDTEDKNKAWEGINFTAVNLYNAGISFEIWNHNGKSPHLHIRNLPIEQLSKEELKIFKRIFIEKCVPKEYLDCVDFSLCGIHLVALEWTNHWKGKYNIKILINKFNPKENF